jgi:hypothetical protein
MWPSFANKLFDRENRGQNKTRPGKILGPGSRVPGLLASCFTWLQAGRLK